MLQKFYQFEGRCPRNEYWIFTAAWIGACIAAFIATMILSAIPYIGPVLSVFAGMASIGVLLISTLAYTCRRFHDIGRSGAMQIPMYLICLTVIGAISLLRLVANLVRPTRRRRRKPLRRTANVAPIPS